MGRVILNIIEYIKDTLKTLITFILSSLDTLGILFTYLSILVVTYTVVVTYLNGNMISPLVGSAIVLLLMKVNRGLKGGN